MVLVTRGNNMRLLRGGRVQALIMPGKPREFTPDQLFLAMRGAWLEPKLGSMWQENTGVTPTTTGGQTIGLLLDQSQGAVLGPELVTNGGFSNGTTGWTPSNANQTVSAGELLLENSSSFGGYSEQQFSTVIGRAYVCGYTTRSGSSSSVQVQCRSSGGSLLNNFVSGTKVNVTGSFIFTATTTTTLIRLYVNSIGLGLTCYFDNISVREILGNHAAQSTAANRPTYQLDSNNLPLARHDATDSLVVSLPDLGGGIYSASGSVYFATPQGMSALHNQSMGLTYTLPAPSTDIYSWMVFPQRLSVEDESNLAIYMASKAGI